jgi:hypothetical protein
VHRNVAGKNRRQACSGSALCEYPWQDNVIKIRPVAVAIANRISELSDLLDSFSSYFAIVAASFRLFQNILRTRQSVAVASRDFSFLPFLLFLPLSLSLSPSLSLSLSLFLSLPVNRSSSHAPDDLKEHRRMISFVNKRQQDLNKIAIRA